MPGVNQVLVRPEIGLTFAKVLRHILRQDPEHHGGGICDGSAATTAEIAIQASLTGHQGVRMTLKLHTRAVRAYWTMRRGPYSGWPSAVIAVMAQRLGGAGCVRPVVVPFVADMDFLKGIGFPVEGAVREVRLWRREL